MKCPACQAAMSELVLDGVSIDRCERCGGVWLDDGEAEALVKAAPDPADELKKKKLDLLRQWKVAPIDPRPTDRPCPRCDDPLERVHYKDVPGLEVDKCAANCGMHLDEGELEKVRLID